MFRKTTSAAIIFLMLSNGTANAATRAIKGPVQAEVVRVVDGDTVLVQAMPWPDHRIDTYVRLRGIDAPELKSECPSFRLAAERAKDKLATLMEGQRSVTLTSITGDKYFGRVVADLTLEDGTQPADLLLQIGLVEPYQGRVKRKRLCPDD
ncbi:thermonuclease family protein [Rhizobium sp. AAP43]|uniref:thermonuclease family protein n=1 Tax=Rhizobium sp. AAP43 TaxID=1523420 RepID=UPI0006B89D98|nr:thermonuclease family protein [Rhizobium sp. AAP43]